MTCLKCGAKNPEGSNFCNKCGEKIEPYSTSFHGNQVSRRTTSLVTGVMIALAVLGVALALLFRKADETPSPEKAIRRGPDKTCAPGYFIDKK